MPPKQDKLTKLIEILDERLKELSPNVFKDKVMVYVRELGEHSRRIEELVDKISDQLEMTYEELNL
jgi:predicted DNA-binding protein